jgi:hypothetical protein
MKYILRQILVASLLIILQVFVLDNLQTRGIMGTLIAFSVYFFYILTLPTGISQSHLFLVSFILGLAVDLFSDTLGIHIAACVFVAFARIQILPFFMGSRQQKQSARSSVYSMGIIPLLYYTLILSFCFHSALCMLEVFSFDYFYITIARIIIGSIISTLIMLIVYLFKRKNSK